jgi:hypothetical protein
MGTDEGSLLTVNQMIVLSTLRYGEKAYESATEAVLKKLEPFRNKAGTWCFHSQQNRERPV